MKSTPTNPRCNLNLSRLVWPRVRWLFPVFAFGIAVSAQPLPAEEATPNKDQPFLRAGKCEEMTAFNSKFIHGWPKSPSFCGLRAANLPGAPFAGKDMAWYVNYSDQALYIKILTMVDPNSENFIAKATEDNAPGILDDDHIVVQVGFDEKVGQDGVPYFRLAMNPNGAVWAYTMEALEGQNHPLDTKEIGRGSWVGVDGARYWIGHLRIPLAMLGTDKLDGKTAKVHIAWSSKPLYLSWGGVKADDWRNTPQILFEPDLLFSFELNKSSGCLLYRSGSLNLDMGGYAGTGTDGKPVDLKIAMRNEAGGKITWEKTWEERKTKGQKMRLGGREQIQGVAEEGNILRMEVTASYDGKEQLLLRNALPFSPKDAKVAEALAAWKNEHSYEMAANAVFDYIYDPYTDKLDALVSTKLNTSLYVGKALEKAKAIVAADKLRLTVTDAAGKEIARADGAVATNAGGHCVAQLPSPLPEGKYKIRLSLVQGETVADEKEFEQVREKFEWERTELGRDKVIIPPWTPVEVARGQGPEVGGQKEGQTSLKCWGRTYALQNNGLPAAMISQGEDVLGGPMRLEGTVDGKPVAAVGEHKPRVTLVPGQIFPADFAKYELANNVCPVAGKDFQLEKTDGYAAEIEADSALGPVGVTVKSRLDYDGLYTIRLTLDPKKAARLDALTLTVPLAKSSDLYRFNRTTVAKNLGAIPEGEGVLARSSQLPAHPALTGSFVPVVYAGQYDHALFWLAESDRGWSVDDADDQVLLVRERGELALKFRFVAKPLALDKPRTLEFAFIASPTRPKAAAYRKQTYAGPDSAGYRFYGAGVDGFQLSTPEDYEALRKYIYESDGFAPHYRDQGDAPPGYASRYRIKNQKQRNGCPATLYGSAFLFNAAMREFPTFGSGWVHTASWDSKWRIDKTFKNMYNFGGTVKWTTDAQLTVVAGPMTDSFVDCWLWHMVQLGKYSFVNGTRYDNFENLPGPFQEMVKTDIDSVAYRREDGQLRPFAVPLRFHERARRFSTALWLIGRPPAQSFDNNWDNCYGYVGFVEGAISPKAVGPDLIEQGMPPAIAAAYTMNASGMARCFSNVRVVGETATERDEREFGIRMAYGILYDVFWTGTPAQMSRVMKEVGAVRESEALSAWEPGVRHLRYWNAKDAEELKVSDKRVLAGGYVNPDRKTALLAVLNPTDGPVKVDLTLGKNMPRGPVTDIMTGKVIAETSSVPLEIERHGSRFLLLKGSK